MKWTPQFEKREVSDAVELAGGIKNNLGLSETSQCVYQHASTNLTRNLNAKEETKEYPEIGQKGEDEGNEGNGGKNGNFTFKSVVVKNLKDAGNYYKFIQNWSQYMAKLQKDKHWLSLRKNKRVLEIVQGKIDDRIHIDFTEALKEMEEHKRFVFLEVDNTIWKITEEVLDGWADPLVLKCVRITKDGNRESKKIYVYLRKFGLEFLEFLWMNHEVILYTHLEKEITEVLISTFHNLKEGIDFAFVIWGKPFWKSINGTIGPVKSLNKIIPSRETLDQDPETYEEFIRNKFLILDAEILSYYHNFEDIHIPILPIGIDDDKFMSNINVPSIKPSWSYSKIKKKMSNRRQSSLKNLRSGGASWSVEDSLKNHCLFYLKQLLSQSWSEQVGSSDLLRSVSISCLVNHT